VSINRASAQSTYGTIYFLPTEDEWYKAAYYDGGAGVYYDYPTGSNSVPVGTRNPQTPPLDAVYYDAHYWQGYPNLVTKAGVASPDGTIGQGGNVWEWNETAFAAARGLRGGAFDTSGSTGLKSSYKADNLPMLENSNYGFRVASVPEPGGITLLGVGVVGLLAFAWRRKRTH
jgi:sulfatase modifying factor 1